MFPVESSDAEIFIKIDKLNRSAWESIQEEELDQAQPILEQVNTLLSSVSDHGFAFLRCKVDYLVNMGDYEQYLSSKSMQYLLEAQSILENITYPQGLLDVLIGMSWGYFFMGDYVKAKSCVEKALQLAESMEDPRRLWRARNAAGAILSETDEQDRAQGYLRANIKNLSVVRENQDGCIAYNNLAMVLLNSEKYKEAEDAALQSLELCVKKQLPITTVCVLDTLGLVYKGKKEFDHSILYFREAVNIQTPDRYKNVNFEPYLHLGEVLLLTGDLEEAESTLNMALQLALEMQGSRLEYACYERLASIYEKKGDYVKALTYYRQFHQEKERIFNQQKIQQIANLISAHQVETTLKDARILELKNASLRKEIESQKRRHEELEHLATTDPLTGLLNRRHLNTLGQFEFENARLHRAPLSVAMIDIDHFKAVNDQFGHLIGDQALMRAAATINAATRNEDLICRYGGEEFLLVIPGQSLQNAQLIVERVRKSIEAQAFSVDDEVFGISISAGITSLRDTDATLEELIARADQALLKAKLAGRNTVLSIE